MPWQLASQASSEKPSENGWFQCCISYSTAQIKGEGFPAHLEQLARPGYQAWKQQNGITWGYWGQNRIQVNSVSSRILKVKKFWNLVFFNSFGGSRVLSKLPSLPWDPHPFEGTLVTAGYVPWPMGAAQESRFPELPWEMKPESPPTPKDVTGLLFFLVTLVHSSNCFSWENFLIHCLGVHCWGTHPKTENLTSTSLQPLLTGDYF